MTTITLNAEKTFDKGITTKYWREITCQPQTVELKKWSTDHPMYTFKGIITNSHDPKEIGIETEITIQSYTFWLEESINDGVYVVN
jgi:hypothetical protein